MPSAATPQTLRRADAGTGTGVKRRGDFPAQDAPVLTPSAATATASRARSPAWPPHRRRSSSPPDRRRRARPVRRPSRRPAETHSSPRPPGRRGHAPPAAARVALARRARPHHGARRAHHGARRAHHGARRAHHGARRAHRRQEPRQRPRDAQDHHAAPKGAHSHYTAAGATGSYQGTAPAHERPGSPYQDLPPGPCHALARTHRGTAPDASSGVC